MILISQNVLLSGLCLMLAQVVCSTPLHDDLHVNLSADDTAFVVHQAKPTAKPDNGLITNNGGRVRRGIINTLTRLHSVGTFLTANNGHNSNSNNNNNNYMSSLLVNSLADAEANKKKPYHFNDVELTAIQALVSIRDILGQILQRVGLNVPALASLINRSESDVRPLASLLMSQASSPLATKSSNVGVLLRGLALSLPLLIPMATQLRRMSVDNVSVSHPLPVPSQILFDPYYNQALHRRRSKRSIGKPPSHELDHIVATLHKMEQLYSQQS